MQDLSNTVHRGAANRLSEGTDEFSPMEIAKIHSDIAILCENDLLVPTLQRLSDPNLGAPGDIVLSDEEKANLRSLVGGHIKSAEVSELKSASVVGTLIGVAFIQDLIRAEIEKYGASNSAQVTRLLMLHNIYSLAALHISNHYKVKGIPEDQRKRLQQLRDNAEAYVESIQADLDKVRGKTHETHETPLATTKSGKVVFVDEEGLNLAQRLGARLRQLRILRKMTQTNVAGDHFSVSYISAVERGQIKPSLDALVYLSGWLRISLSDLMENIE